MYDVAPFVTPVPQQHERHNVPSSTQEDLEAFRYSRSRSAAADVVRQHLGLQRVEVSLDEASPERPRG